MGLRAFRQGNKRKDVVKHPIPRQIVMRGERGKRKDEMGESMPLCVLLFLARERSNLIAVLKN
jgi:hypothetical protein